MVVFYFDSLILTFISESFLIAITPETTKVSPALIPLVTTTSLSVRVKVSIFTSLAFPLEDYVFYNALHPFQSDW